MGLTAVAFNCTLKSSGEASSTELLLGQIIAAMQPHGVEGDIVRVVDHDVKPGVNRMKAKATTGPGFAR